MNLNYRDFAVDELTYLVKAYNLGLRCNPMVSQAQRICECLLKHVMSTKLMNNHPAMMSHNLRSIFDAVEESGIKLDDIRTEVMLLNNFYTHTRYPGKDAFIAQRKDIEASFTALSKIYDYMLRFF